MRRIGIICGVLVVMAIFLVPSMAQSRAKSISDIVDSGIDPTLQFTILEELLEAAPRIRNRLDRQGQFTLFAPDDNAFLKMQSSTGLTPDDILSDRELVTAILNYHIIDRPLSAEQLRIQNGNLLLTTLNDSTIAVNLNVDNTISLNLTTTIISENIIASNGYIHVIDDVLSNSIITTIVEENGTDSTEPETTTTPVAVAQAQTVATTANIRIAHFSPDAPDVDVILNDEVLFEDHAYESVSDFEPLDQGIYTASIVSTDVSRQFEVELDLTVLDGDFVTILLIGSYEDDDLQVVTLQEDFSATDEDEVRLLFYNAIQESPSANMMIDGEVLFESVSFAEFERAELDAGEVVFSIVRTRDVNDALINAEDLNLNATSFYSIVMYGTESDPEWALIENSLEEILDLQSGQSNNNDENGDSSTGGSDTLDIVEVLDESDDFTWIIRVVAALDEEQGDERLAVDILGNVESEPVTFFAPNDQAFENLLATIGYSENRFLADTDLMSNILLYHITEDSTGALTANQLREQPGSYVTQLSLRDAFFVRVSSDNRIIVNGFVEIIESDIQAANGIIHVVDNVLLPQVVLDDLGL